MKKYFSILILIFFLLLVNSTWYYIFKREQAKAKHVASMQNSEYLALNKVHKLKENLINMAFSEELKVQIKDSLIKNNIVIKNDRNFYIGFYFNKSFCEACFLPIIQDLNTLRLEYQFKGTLFFSNKNTNFEGIDTLNYKNHQIVVGEIPILKENNIGLLLFTIDTNLRVQDVYCPDFFPQFQQVFFQQLKQRIKTIN